MNASPILPHAAPDTALLNRWATGNPTGDVDDDCPCCRGTGLGQYDGAPCRQCGGTGELLECALFDEPQDLDDDAFDAYMVGAYEAAVA